MRFLRSRHSTTSSADFGHITRCGALGLGDIEFESTAVALAAGANAVLVRERLEIGAVYTTVIGSTHDIDVNGLLVKMTLRY
jgi:hypothetical protein